MSVLTLQKYCGLYESLEAVKNIDGWHTGAYLLCGEDEDGLKALARVVAAKLCGIKTSTAFDGHADIVVYPKPADAKKSKSKSDASSRKKYAVSVDDIREIVDSLYLTPFELSGRVYIIENAESMSEICQNKLLKSLEEPPARVCFILCSSGRLLPTVESRCNRIELAPFSFETVKRELSRFCKDAAAVELASRASRGNLGMAEQILADSSFADTYATAKKLLSLATGSRMFASCAAVYEKLTRDKADAVLGVTEYLLCDVMRLTVGESTVFDASDIRAVSAGFTPLSAARCCDCVRTARRHLDANCMPQSVLDNLVLKIMEEKALCQR